MKKVLVPLMLFLWLSHLSFAQEQSTKRTEEYCDAFIWEKTFGKQVYLSVDFGQPDKKPGEKMLDVDGNPLVFNSPVDALNYLNRQGWELVNVYVLRENKTDYRHYLMRRKVNVQ